MILTTEQLEEGLKKVVLNGRLDLKGVLEIEEEFTTFTAADNDGVIVDLGGVDFIASVAIRLLISSAKRKVALGGKMVLFGAQSAIQEMLDVSGIVKLIPLVKDEASARIAAKP